MPRVSSSVSASKFDNSTQALDSKQALTDLDEIRGANENRNETYSGTKNEARSLQQRSSLNLEAPLDR